MQVQVVLEADDTAFKPPRNAHSVRLATGKDTAGKSKGAVVSKLDDLLLVGKRNDWKHRAKSLDSHCRHLWCTAGQPRFQVEKNHLSGSQGLAGSVPLPWLSITTASLTWRSTTSNCDLVVR